MKITGTIGSATSSFPARSWPTDKDIDPAPSPETGTVYAYVYFGVEDDGGKDEDGVITPTVVSIPSTVPSPVIVICGRGKALIGLFTVAVKVTILPLLYGQAKS
jgi:hypothetical protein